MRIVNIPKLDQELREAGIPIDGVRGDGTIDFREDVTEDQRQRAQEILEAHDPTPDTGQLRLQAYREAVPMDEFMEAYFEAQFEGKPDKLETLQARRVDVKARFPKK